MKIFNIDSVNQNADESGGVEINDFEFIKLLGKGAYGGVYLARKKKVDDLYAIKIIDIQQQVFIF